MADDLNTPLGQSPKPKRRLPPLAVPHAIAALLGICLLFFIGWSVFVEDPLGGEPIVVVSADVRAPGQKPAEATPSSASSAAQPASPIPPGTQTVTIIDGMSGKRQAVVVGGGEKTAPAASPPPDNPNAKPDVQQAPPIDQRLVEKSAHGPIPKIGPDGARAAEVYAQPVKAAAGKPRVVIVVGGLGIGASGTFDALGKLPAPVTLAFTPYGNDLERWIGRARGEGHEVLLQIPMEPFDYPENDPGPQTLLTSLSAEQNIDRMHWFMSRFHGYVGIASYMGGKLTSNDAAMGVVMREGAKRGLIYFDDATAPRSVAGQIAGANSVAFAKADLVLDTLPTPNAIEAALVRLESLARERGVAIGAASASPAAIDRIAQWAKSAEGRGITLVPLSAVANKQKSS